MIPNLARLAADSMPGNGTGNNQPAQVSSSLTSVFTQAGFKRQKQPGLNNSAVYFHPASGAKVTVHPAPAGKKWSSKWTHVAEDGKATAGAGCSLTKLLSALIAEAEAKKAAALATKINEEAA